MRGTHSAKFENIQISNLLEFGRILHAEMAAITEAARLGVSLRGTTLYCTTFPCHLCARLIIAAGISRVVYVEPYPKSKTADLYPASVSIDSALEPSPQRQNSGSVKFDSFVGVAPNRFVQLFQMAKRKDVQGNVIEWEKDHASPRPRQFLPLYMALEQMVITALPHKLQEVGLQLKT